ncbi:hypothetical protein Tco_0458511 [Tanacetum coccineum]
MFQIPVVLGDFLQESYSTLHKHKLTVNPTCSKVPYVNQQGKYKSMVAEKDDISETIVKVDSQMMIQKNDVCSQQFRPQTSMSNDVCSQQFRPQTSMSNDV